MFQIFNLSIQQSPGATIKKEHQRHLLNFDRNSIFHTRSFREPIWLVKFSVRSMSGVCQSVASTKSKETVLEKKTLKTRPYFQPSFKLLTVLMDVYDFKNERTLYSSRKTKNDGIKNKETSRECMIIIKIPRTVVRFQLIGKGNQSTARITKFKDNLFFVDNVDQIELSVDLVF